MSKGTPDIKYDKISVWDLTVKNFSLLEKDPDTSVSSNEVTCFTLVTLKILSIKGLCPIPIHKSWHTQEVGVFLTGITD